MTCNRRRCERSSVTSTTIAVTAVLIVLISAPGSASQRASVYAPVVVSAHDPASANPMLGAAFSPSAHGVSSSEAPAAQGQLPGSTAAPAPAPASAPDAGSSTTAQSPHVTSGHTDNDVHLQPSASSLPAQTDNPTLHAEAREEADNRIADPDHLPSAAPASAAPSAPDASPAAWPSGATDAADAADAATALPHANPTVARVPLWLDTIAPHAAIDVQHPTASPGNANETQTSSVSAAIVVPSSSAAPAVSQNVSSEANQTSRAFSESARRSVQYVSAGGQQNIPQVSSPSKGSSFGIAPPRKAIPSAAVVNATTTTTTTPTTVRDISADAFVPGQNKTAEPEDEAYPDEVFTEDPEDSTVDLSTVTDALRDDTTTFVKLENDGMAPSSNASFLDDDVALETHPCARECVTGAPPMRCYYRFEVTGYYTMSKACYDCPANREDCDLPECVAADGVPRGLVVVNRQMPGPAVEVCLGDRIVVDLHNGLVAETTSVHWHGHHQRGTPYMDGVPHVTQCPVPPMTTFRYTFKADTPGTHFWHSHTGHQRADGAFGSLVVRVPREADAHAALWDRDERAHTLLLLDWGAAGGAERFLAHHHAGGPNKPTALLVNGRGRVPPSPLPRANASATADNATAPVPAPEFVVTQGLRYRFRLINAGFLNCPIELSVDDHDMLIIASDGSDIKPVAAASLVTYAGERFDFIIEANRSVSTYWIRMRGLLDCGENFTAVHQAAILRYEGATEAEPPGELSYAAAHRPGHQVNSLNVGTGTAGSSVIPELDAIVPDDESLKEEPDYRFYLAYDFYAVDNPHFHKAPYYGFYNVSSKMQTYTPQFNHISMKMPSVPMLPQHEQLDERQFCNATSMEGQGCKERYCECSHVIQVPLHSVLEIVLIDEGVTYNANHPFHLHGYAFRVVGMERLGESTSLEEVKRLDEQGLLKRKLHAAPLKDTCTVPDGGYTILRVQANNPGYWLFHCHIEFHVEIGMALVFKIGEHSEFPPAPKGFPRCGDWAPDDDDIDADVSAEAAPEDTRKAGREDAHEDASANEVASVGATQKAVVSGAPHKSGLHETQPAAVPRSSAAAAALSTSGLLLAILTSTFTLLCSR